MKMKTCDFCYASLDQSDVACVRCSWNSAWNKCVTKNGISVWMVPGTPTVYRILDFDRDFATLEDALAAIPNESTDEFDLPSP